MNYSGHYILELVYKIKFAGLFRKRVGSMKIGFVADTSSNFTLESAGKLGIHIVPMQIVIDQKSYKDGIDLSIEEFYQKNGCLKGATQIFSTSNW